MLCLLCSTLFHTMSCHSEWVSNVFSRLDYAGIALLIVGSSITWLYYGFYCQFYHKLTYVIAIAFLGILTIILTMMDRFNKPVSRLSSGSIGSRGGSMKLLKKFPPQTIALPTIVNITFNHITGIQINACFGVCGIRNNKCSAYCTFNGSEWGWLCNSKRSTIPRFNYGGIVHHRCFAVCESYSWTFYAREMWHMVSVASGNKQ